MKSLQAHNLKTIALIKVVYPVIHRYEDQVFDDISGESEKTKNILSTLLLINNCSLFQLKALLSRANKMVN